jgi:hypothetical protein
MKEFHKIWIDQCDAAEGIQERFGTQDAIRYLVGEKLMNFLQATEGKPEFQAELPVFVSRIKELFEPFQLQAYFDDAEAGRVPDPHKIFNGKLPGDENELDEAEILYDAEKILLLENARSLLLPETS